MPYTLWRLVPEQHADKAFSGEGAKRFGGRWNRPGVPMVYTSETLALAVLETLVHLQPEDLGQGYVFFRVNVPDEVALPTATWALPPDWRREPPPSSTQDVGSDWVHGNTSALLRVPSVVIPQEHNILIHPGHPDFSWLEIGSPEPFRWDVRLR